MVFQDFVILLAKIPPTSFIFYGKFGDKSSQSPLSPPPRLLHRWVYNHWLFWSHFNFWLIIMQSSNYSKFLRFDIDSAIIEFDSLKWLWHCICNMYRRTNTNLENCWMHCVETEMPTMYARPAAFSVRRPIDS